MQTTELLIHRDTPGANCSLGVLRHLAPEAMEAELRFLLEREPNAYWPQQRLSRSMRMAGFITRLRGLDGRGVIRLMRRA